MEFKFRRSLEFLLFYCYLPTCKYEDWSFPNNTNEPSCRNIPDATIAFCPCQVDDDATAELGPKVLMPIVDGAVLCSTTCQGISRSRAKASANCIRYSIVWARPEMVKLPVA